jgi:hypothetical protein
VEFFKWNFKTVAAIGIFLRHTPVTIAQYPSSQHVTTLQGGSMAAMKYQVESAYLMVGPLLPEGGVKSLQLHNHGLAIVVASKSVTIPYGHEIRVVNVATGEVIFQKTAATIQSVGDDY